MQGVKVPCILAHRREQGNRQPEGNHVVRMCQDVNCVLVARMHRHSGALENTSTGA